jgi:hypothetical protein
LLTERKKVYSCLSVTEGSVAGSEDRPCRTHLGQKSVAVSNIVDEALSSSMLTMLAILAMQDE